MEEFFTNPENWAAIGFVVFFTLVGKRAWTFITGWLDSHSSEIKIRLDDAIRLREEAQELLKKFEQKQRNAEKESEEIIARANKEASRIMTEAETVLEAAIKRRQQLAMEHIGQAESKALQEVREAAIEMTISNAEDFIKQEIDDNSSEFLIDNAINELNNKLN